MNCIFSAITSYFVNETICAYTNIFVSTHRMLPTIALVKNEKILGYVVGLDEIGGRDDFPTEALAVRLARDGLINWVGWTF